MKKFKSNWNKFWTLSRRENRGFTLVELIVVIAILAILAGVAVPAYNGYIEKANEAADNQLLAALNTAFTSACIDKGEFDLKNLSARPQATIDDNGVVTLDENYNNDFQRYFANSGVFKTYDILGFNSDLGVFIGNSVEQLKKLLNESWNGSSFDDETGIVADMLLKTFDQIGVYFGKELTIDKLFANSPQALKDVFNFGEYNSAMDLSEDEVKEILANAGLEDTEANRDLVRGNAYVLHFANDAVGRSAATIKEDVTNFKDLMRAGYAKAITMQGEEVLEYYKTLPGAKENATVQEAIEALQLGPNGEVSAQMVVAMAKIAEDPNSTIKGNTSGISTLGSVYALTAGYLNSTEYKNYINDGGQAINDPKYGEFSTVAQAIGHGAFDTYLANSAEKDIDAYLNFMSYLSTGNIDKASNSAFAGQYRFIAEALGLPEQPPQ